MSVGCPRRHLSYSQWRLQVFRRLFCPSQLRSALESAASGFHGLPQRVGNHRSLTTSRTRSARRKSNRGRSDKDDGDDPFAILEEAARRTTSPQVINPSTSLQPDRLSSRRSKRRHSDDEDEDAFTILEEGARRTTSQQVVGPSISLRSIPVSSRRSKKRHNDKEDDDDTFVVLDEAARRTTSPQVINPSTSLPPNPVLRSGSDRPYQQFVMDASVPEADLGKRKQQQQKVAKPTPKTRKQIEEDEALAFLKGAEKHVIGLRIPEKATSPAQPRERSSSALEMRKQVEREDGAAPSEAATKCVTPLRMFEQSNASRMRKQMENEEIIKRVNRRWPSDLPHLSTRFPEEISVRNQNLVKPEPILGEQRAIPYGQRIGTFGSSMSGTDTRVRGQVRNENSVNELQRWFREAAEREKRRNERGLRRLATNRNPHPPRRAPAVTNFQEAGQTKVPCSIEPLKPRASKPVNSTKQSEVVPGKGDSLVQPASPESSLDAITDLEKLPSTVNDINGDSKLDVGRAEDPASPGIDGLTGDGMAPKSLNSFIPSQNDLLPSSDGVGESGSKSVHFEHKGFRGVLSKTEHEQLSALFASLQDTLAHAPKLPLETSGQEVGLMSSVSSATIGDDQTPEQRGEVNSLSESLPLSPYQRLQAKERRIKERAVAKSKQRLCDNPWAQWLASPIRMCQATGVRLPNKLMVGWNCVRNPKDSQVYLMPEELADMGHLGTGHKNHSPASRKSEEETVQEIPCGDSVVNATTEKPTTTVTPANSLHSADSSSDQTEGDGIKRSTELEANPETAKGKPPIAPARIYMRPSSILLLELDKRMLNVREHGEADDHASPVHIRTNLSAVNRLLPNRWKDQARKFEKSSDAQNPQAGFLTTKEMRQIQWHPNIQDVMLNLLRSRVFKALESAVVRNSGRIGIHRRMLPLPLAEPSSGVEDAAATTLSGIEQAVFLWLGSAESDRSNTPCPPGPQAIGPSTCHNCTLQFIPRNDTAAELDISSPSSAGHTQNKPFLPIRTHTPPSPGTEQINPDQNLYIPPFVSLHLPQTTTNNNTTATSSSSSSSSSSNNNQISTTTHNLLAPIFNLPPLLGKSYTSKLHALAQDNLAVGAALGLDNDIKDKGESSGSDSGLVMVKGGKGTVGFKILVQELWRLWIFGGGRSFAEEGE